MQQHEIHKPLHACSSNNLAHWLRAIAIACLNSCSAAAISAFGAVLSTTAFRRRSGESNAPTPERADVSNVASSNSIASYRLPAQFSTSAIKPLTYATSRCHRSESRVTSAFDNMLRPFVISPHRAVNQPSRHWPSASTAESSLLRWGCDQSFQVTEVSRLIADRLICPRRGRQRHRIGERPNTKRSRAFNGLLGMRNRAFGITQMRERVRQIRRCGDIRRRGLSQGLEPRSWAFATELECACQAFQSCRLQGALGETARCPAPTPLRQSLIAELLLASGKCQQIEH